MSRLPRMIFATLVMAGFVYYYATTRVGGASVQLQKAVAAYQNGDVKGALKIIEAEPGQYVELENGCELVISVFAESNRPKMLEAIALKCLNANKALGIAHEGYAKALVEQNRIDQAILFMEKEVELQEVGARVHGALANLYQLKGDFKKAGDSYLIAIKSAKEGWTMWMGAALKRDQLTQSKEFLKSLVHTIAEKPSSFENAERPLIEILENHGLVAEADLLRKRYN